MALRPYQVEAKDEIRLLFRKKKRRIIYTAPTGSGKTVTFASIAQDAVAMGSKVMIVVDRKELLDQAANKLREYGLHVTIITGGRRPKYAGRSAFVATVQTLLNRPLPDIDLLIIDEAHKQSFDKVLQRPEYGSCFVIGATATPHRTGKMTQLADLYHDMVETTSIPELVENGFLKPARTYAPQGADMTGVGTVMTPSGPDYNARGMFQAFDKLPLYEGVVDQYQKFASGTKAICFNINVEHSINTTAAFRRAGINAVHLDGDASKIVRENTLFDFKQGRIQVLCNCDLFTTGFDEPSIETVIVNRATKSIPLWLQMCGRGSRPFGRKEHFKIIDMGGNLARLGFWEQPREFSLTHTSRKSEGTAPVKECGGGGGEKKTDANGNEGCSCYIHASVMTCPYCGYIFPKPEKKTVAAEFKEILMKSPPLPANLKMPVSQMTIEQLEELRKHRGYSIGWLVNQVVRRDDLSLDELAAYKGYKRKWIETTRDRLGLKAVNE